MESQAGYLGEYSSTPLPGKENCRNLQGIPGYEPHRQGQAQGCRRLRRRNHRGRSAQSRQHRQPVTRDPRHRLRNGRHPRYRGGHDGRHRVVSVLNALAQLSDSSLQAYRSAVQECQSRRVHPDCSKARGDHRHRHLRRFHLSAGAPYVLAVCLAGRRVRLQIRRG